MFRLIQDININLRKYDAKQRAIYRPDGASLINVARKHSHH